MHPPWVFRGAVPTPDIVLVQVLECCFHFSAVAERVIEFKIDILLWVAGALHRPKVGIAHIAKALHRSSKAKPPDTTFTHTLLQTAHVALARSIKFIVS